MLITLRAAITNGIFLGFLASATAGAQTAGSWQPVGTGDCPGRDVASSRGPGPDPARCNSAFAGLTAVCWNDNCTYKNIATGSCTGGANPGRMFTCGGAPAPSTGGWQAVGAGDCPGRDVASSRGPSPDPARCSAEFAGLTAVCWNEGCTYKNIATGSCTGGQNPGRMFTCGIGAPPPSTGGWRSVGAGDCPGRDVASSRGPNPDPSRCSAEFAGLTAVCWNESCTYKNIATGSCTGGANPGRMFTCGTGAPPPSTGGWRSVGTGDCPGRDVASSRGPNPDPSRCSAAFAGLTAVCWNEGCTYKNIATGSCTGGQNPGRMFTCGGAPAPSTGGWRSVGAGDCPGRDVASSRGPNPDPSRCSAEFAGLTAVCWNEGCTYKNIATGSCTGGQNPGRMFTCGQN